MSKRTERNLGWDDEEDTPRDRGLGWDLEDRQTKAQRAFDANSGTEGYPLQTREDEDVLDTVKDAALKGANMVVDGLDYAGNVSRGMINAAIRGKSVEKAFDDALTYKDRTRASDIRWALSRRFGHRLKWGKDDNEFQWGDIGDVAMDLGIDIVTDPLTWLTFGTSGLIKGLGGKAAREATEAAAKEAGKEVVSKVAVAQKTGRRNIHELSGRKRDVVTKAQLDEAIEKQGKIERVDLEELIKAPTQKRIEKGMELGILDEMDLLNRTRQSAKRIGTGATVAKEGFASGMGGLYTAASQIDDDTTAQDFARNFAVGAGLTRLGRWGINKASQKGYFSAIGNALDSASSAGRKAKMIVFGKQGAKEIATKADAGQMAQIASDAGQSKRHAYMGIRNAFKNAIEKMKQGDSVAAADSLLAVEHFRDMNVKLREELWEKELAKLSPEQLDQYNLVKGKEGDILKRWSEVEGKEILPLKQKVQRDANAMLVNRDGTIKEAAFMKWAKDNEIANTETVLRNMNVWQKATKESFDIEKKFIRDNLLKVKERGGIFDETDILNMRRKAFEEEGQVGDFADLLNYDDIKTAMDLRLNNEGLGVWTPRRAEVGMGTTVTESGRRMPMTPNVRQRAAKDLRAASDRAVLSREEMANYINNGRKLEDAQAYINKFEAAANISAENKARGVLNTIQREAGAYMGDIATNQKPFAANIRKMNALVKRGLLLGSYTWIKNNLWSNARQAFAKHGIFAGVDAANPINYWATDLGKDIRKIFSSGSEKMPPWTFSDADTVDMINRGIIEPTHFQEVRKTLSDEDLRFMFTDEQLKTLAEREGKAGARTLQALDEAGDWFSRKLGTKQWGARVEAMARGATYKRTVKMLRGQDRYRTLVDNFGKELAEESIKRQAKDLTNDVFFDYGKLRYWESSFIRELVPFYSFYKQNTMYQARALLDPETVPRLAALSRMQDGRYFGADPMTQQQKDSLPNWTKRQNAYTYTDKDGNTKIRYTTSDPAGQMWSSLSSEDWFKDFSQYLNPALKSAFEQMAGYDMFRGESMIPRELSGDPDKQIKYLYSQGFGPMEVFNVINKVISDNPDVIWTKHGNPVTDSEGTARVMNIMSWAAAQYVNQANQLYAQYRKYKAGKTDAFGVLTNLFGPISETQMIREQAQRNLEQAEAKRVEERIAPELKLRRRALGDLPGQ